jgi:hypothetical protein
VPGWLRVRAFPNEYLVLCEWLRGQKLKQRSVVGGDVRQRVWKGKSVAFCEGRVYGLDEHSFDRVDESLDDFISELPYSRFDHTEFG